MNLTTVDKVVLAERFCWPSSVTIKPIQKITPAQRRQAEEHLYGLGLMGHDCSLTEDGRRQAVGLLTVRDWAAS